MQKPLILSLLPFESQFNPLSFIHYLDIVTIYSGDMKLPTEVHLLAIFYANLLLQHLNCGGAQCVSYWQEDSPSFLSVRVKTDPPKGCVALVQHIAQDKRYRLL